MFVGEALGKGNMCPYTGVAIGYNSVSLKQSWTLKGLWMSFHQDLWWLDSGIGPAGQLSPLPNSKLDCFRGGSKDGSHPE